VLGTRKNAETYKEKGDQIRAAQPGIAFPLVIGRSQDLRRNPTRSGRV